MWLVKVAFCGFYIHFRLIIPAFIRSLGGVSGWFPVRRPLIGETFGGFGSCCTVVAHGSLGNGVSRGIFPEGERFPLLYYNLGYSLLTGQRGPPFLKRAFTNCFPCEKVSFPFLRGPKISAFLGGTHLGGRRGKSPAFLKNLGAQPTSYSHSFRQV